MVDKDEIQDILDKKDDLLSGIADYVSSQFDSNENKKADNAKGGQLVIPQEDMQGILVSYCAMETTLDIGKIDSLLANDGKEKLSQLTEEIIKNLSGGKEPTYTCDETVRMVEEHLKYLFNLMEKC